jgi:hypothetical protein
MLPAVVMTWLLSHGVVYVRNSKGCLLANFKPGRGNYPEDGGLYTVKADAYFPNDYGLYNMAGNVAEWTSSAFYENAYSFIHDLNPDIRYDAKGSDPEAYKRKVIRGGSWKDVMFLPANRNPSLGIPGYNQVLCWLPLCPYLPGSLDQRLLRSKTRQKNGYCIFLQYPFFFTKSAG